MARSGVTAAQLPAFRPKESRSELGSRLTVCDSEGSEMPAKIVMSNGEELVVDMDADRVSEILSGDARFSTFEVDKRGRLYLNREQVAYVGEHKRSEPMFAFR